MTGISSPHLVLVDGTLIALKNLYSCSEVCMPFKNTSDSSEESEPLERLWSISLDGASDTSSPESVDDYGELPDDRHGCSLSQEEARAPSLQRRAQIKRHAPSCTACDENIRGNVMKELPREGIFCLPQKAFVWQHTLFVGRVDIGAICT